MAFVNVPKDLNKIKTKVALNMTKRQLLCFGSAALIGIPTYLVTRVMIGNTASVFLMMALMAPLFLLGMYEKDGLPAEKIIRNYIRTKFYWVGTRTYQSSNFYETLANPPTNPRSEVMSSEQTTKTTAKTAQPKHSGSQSQSQSTPPRK